MKKQTFILLGATGSLASKKIYPALGRLYRDGYIHYSEFKLIGVSIEDKMQEEFQHTVREKSAVHIDNDRLIDLQYPAQGYLGKIAYVQMDILRDGFDKLAEEILPESEVIFYLSISPSLFMTALEKIAICQTINRERIKIMIEKPYGVDLEDTMRINRYVAEHFQENQIYRIDHYLAKEGIKELQRCKRENLKRWNHIGIEEVSIILTETVGIEDRLEFYRETGAITDVVQNHIFQLLLSTISLEPEKLADLPETKMDTEGLETGDRVVGFGRKKDIDGILRSFDRGKNHFHCMQYLDFEKETLVYGRVFPDLENWRNVEFNLITGKKMAEKKTQIVIKFRQDKEPRIIDFLEPASSSLPEYARLMLNCMQGKNENFVSSQEAEATWIFGDKIRDTLKRKNETVKIDKYEKDKIKIEDVLAWCKR